MSKAQFESEKHKRTKEGNKKRGDSKRDVREERSKSIIGDSKNG